MRTEQTIRNSYVVTAGVTEYSVSFPLYEEGDVAVFLSRDGGESEERLALGTHYTVAINSGRNGGTVTLKAGAAEAGNILALLSNVPYTQELDLTNVSTIDVESTETQLDRTTQQIQQIKELSDRHLAVPATSQKTPQEVMAEIFSTVAMANEYAKKAVEAYEQALILKDTVEGMVTAKGDEQVARVEEAGDKEVSDVAAEGQAQLDKLAGYADVAALAEGLACAMQVWTLAEDAPSGTEITLPNEMLYIPGRHHLFLSVGGMVISPTWYDEGEPVNGVSHTFVTRISLKAGQEIMAWVIPLGKYHYIEVESRITALEDALAELSRKVVYVDENTEASSEGESA